MALPVEPLEPVRRSVTVAVAPERAFAVFAGEIGRWWPLARHSVGGERSLDVTIEPRQGGAIVERIEGGESARWGTVLAWEPPHRLAFSWHPGKPGDGPVTDVEVLFAPDGAGGTRVDLAHRGWERLAAPLESRTSYLNGWPAVMAAFAAHVGEGARAGAAAGAGATA